MRRLFTICLLALSATALLAGAPSASAASGAKPTITRVLPMRVSVGNVLTIRGHNFKAKRTANTVIFRAPSGRSAFAKPRRASRKKLVLVVPGSVSRLLAGSLSKPRPTRLKLRVLAGKFSAFTSRRLSPVVTGFGKGDGRPGGALGGRPGTGPGTGAPGAAVKVCANDADHDNDLLANDFETQLGTDPCLADTDGDQMTDGWEYYAAKDLNLKAVPYPGKRPFPNALDPSDGSAKGTFSAIDFDGDGLTTVEEYRAWRFTGSSFDPSRVDGYDPVGLQHESPLSYSDGTKFSRASETPSVPAWRGPSLSPPLPAPKQTFPATYDMNGDLGLWRDDERDADRDGLANWLESARGPGKTSWWTKYWNTFKPPARPWGHEPATDCGQEFGDFTERPFQELDMADNDVDGDTLLDGEDDQDNDDFNNITELYEAAYDLDGDKGFTCVTKDEDGKVVSIETYPSIARDTGSGPTPWGINPFNPCAPNPDSRTCHDYKPLH